MSSLAQEESRSLSENVTWGQRKRMADGKVTLPYKQFLGYEKGEDGTPVINEDEAAVVRLIYRLFMEGKTFSAIAKYLMAQGIPTPSGKKNWQSSVVQSILTNEKFKGEALMQKTYCADYLKKKMVKNTGQVQQFYVTESHPAIITPEEFDEVQTEIERRKSLGRSVTCNSIFATKLVCGECGGWLGQKVLGSYKDDKSHRREVWRCNDKYPRSKKPGTYCKTPLISEEDIKSKFLSAFNRLTANRDGLIEDCRLAQSIISDTTAIDAELSELQNEMAVAAELSRRAIQNNARMAQDQREFNERNNGYLERHRIAKERADALSVERQERVAKGKMLDRFIRDIENRPLAIDTFDEKLWTAVIDRAVVATDGTITFRFKDGSEITE